MGNCSFKPDGDGLLDNTDDASKYSIYGLFKPLIVFSLAKQAQLSFPVCDRPRRLRKGKYHGSSNSVQCTVGVARAVS